MNFLQGSFSFFLFTLLLLEKVSFMIILLQGKNNPYDPIRLRAVPEQTKDGSSLHTALVGALI